MRKNFNYLYFWGKKSRAQVRLKKIEDADFGENNSQDKWLLPCPLPIVTALSIFETV
jgi:hypothetical protein